MGLLDDAIREHLDLKRRRGADPAEVERAEREALGPVRRNREPATAGGVAAEAEPLGAAVPAYDHADEEGWAAEPDGEEWEAGPAPESRSEDIGSEDWVYDSTEDRPAATPRAVSPPPLELADDEDHFAELEPEPEPEPEPPPRRRFGRLSRHSAQPAPPPLEEVGGGETVEYDVPHTVGGAGPQSDEDVLEETPEFLQDTPDHDRLWFEQRPPRDFDFDD
jgi:hypothetical protein